MAYLSTKRISITESYFGDGFELLTEEAQENKVKEKLDDAVKDAANKPKGWIANKIYSFRQLYKSYLDKANREHDSGKIGFFKNIARMILSCIDKLAKMMQNITDNRSVVERKREENEKEHGVSKAQKIQDHSSIKQAISKMPKEKQDNWTNHPKYGDLRDFKNFDKAMQDPNFVLDF